MIWKILGAFLIIVIVLAIAVPFLKSFGVILIWAAGLTFIGFGCYYALRVKNRKSSKKTNTK